MKDGKFMVIVMMLMKRITIIRCNDGDLDDDDEDDHDEEDDNDDNDNNTRPIKKWFFKHPVILEHMLTFNNGFTCNAQAKATLNETCALLLP